MKPVRPAYLPTLLELLMLGAKDQPVRVTTVELAKRLGRSQQAASKHLYELERDGYIVRVKSGQVNHVKLTEKGLGVLTTLYTTLKSILEAVPKVYELKGYLFSGLREGAYYISLRGYRRQFIRKLGFDPYPGTLNIKLVTSVDRSLKRELDQYQGIGIEGFEDEHRTYGGARCFPAVVNDVVKGAVIILERTHYDDSVIEVIAPVEIRSVLGLKDGDLVRVKVFPLSEAKSSSSPQYLSSTSSF